MRYSTAICLGVAGGMALVSLGLGARSQASLILNGLVLATVVVAHARAFLKERSR
jgi:hypothetical protein